MGEETYAVVDLGGTKTIVMLVDAGGVKRERLEFKTPRTGDRRIFSQSIYEYIEAACTKNKVRLLAVGICVAGFVGEHGVVMSSPNISALQNFPLKDETWEHFSVPVVVENDANAAAYGELCYGAGKGKNNIVFITVSTGVGCGLIINKQIYRGSGGFAGEIGHMHVIDDETVCGCGNRGCLEKVASGEGIARQARDHYGRSIDTREVFRALNDGDRAAGEIVHKAVDCLARGIGNTINLLNPEKIIIGGGVAGGAKNFILLLREKVKQYTIPCAMVSISHAELGPDAGIWGIAALLREANY